MNKRDWIVLSVIERYGYTNQRDLVTRTGYSLGVVNASLKKLMTAGWLDRNHRVTQKVVQRLEEARPRQAVILAAGMGLRMMPFHHTPKGLLEVNGEVLIERIIKQLHAAEIRRIAVVTGYRSEQFSYLRDRFSVALIENPEFARWDSLHSLACAADWLENCYVVGSDIWFVRSPFSKTEYHSWYAVSGEPDRESLARVNRKIELVRTEEDQEGNAMLGVSYLLGLSAQAVRENLVRMDGRQRYQKAVWEEALFSVEGKMIPYAKIMQGQAAYGLKTSSDLRALDSKSADLQNERERLIRDVYSYADNLAGSIRAIYPRPDETESGKQQTE